MRCPDCGRQLDENLECPRCGDAFTIFKDKMSEWLRRKRRIHGEREED